MTSKPNRAVRAREAERRDASAITAIYNQGIEDRAGTFETEPRSVDQIEAWFDHARAFVAVEDEHGDVVGYAVAILMPTAAAMPASVSSRSTSAAISAVAASAASPWRP